MALCDGLSHCKLALAFAVLMDLVGGAALLMGVFARLEVKGQDFGDLLVYTGMEKPMHAGKCRFWGWLFMGGPAWPELTSAGALLVLASLAGWVLWYSGNIDGLTSRKELGHIGSAVDRLARNLSRKMRTYRSQYWSKTLTSVFLLLSVLTIVTGFNFSFKFLNISETLNVILIFPVFIFVHMTDLIHFILIFANKNYFKECFHTIEYVRKPLLSLICSRSWSYY